MGRFDKKFLALCLFAAFLYAVISGLLIFNGLFFPWNYIRLASSLLIVQGHSLYPDANSPLVTGWIYGPVAPLWYMPSALLGSLSAACILGEIESLFIVLLPIALWHFFIWKRGNGTKAYSLAGFLLFFTFILLSPGLRMAVFTIHADAPAMGFGGLACFFLWRSETSANRRDLTKSAFFTVLSVLSKQPMAPMPIALIAYLLWRRQKRQAMHYALAGAAFGTAALWAASAIWGAGPLWFNLVELPRETPWAYDLTFPSASFFVYYLRAGSDLIFDHLTELVLILFLLLANQGKHRDSSNPSPGPLLFLVGIALAPLSLAALLRVGGDLNSISFPLYFWMACLSLSLPQVEKNAFVQRVFPALFALLLAVAISRQTIFRLDRLSFPTDEQVAFNYLRHHENESIFFVSNPFAQLAAKRPFYGFAYGLYDRIIAGRKEGARKVPSVIKDIQKIVLAMGSVCPVGKLPFSVYLPAEAPFRLVSEPELPGWCLVARDPVPAPWPID